MHFGVGLRWIVICFLVINNTTASFAFESSFTVDHIKYLKNETKNLFQHGWDSYMKYGFPADEVRPDSCVRYGPDYRKKEDVVRNDSMGNFSSTILDNIDSLIIMEKWTELEFVLEYLRKERYTLFNTDTSVQVFETTIRALGGLLSSHLLMTEVLNSPRFKHFPQDKALFVNYDGFLLEIATDLGHRLLPAFQTGAIALPRINLKKGLSGVPKKLQKETCLAGAASPLLEFSLLSRLTGDYIFEAESSKVFWTLWNSRSDLDLVPTTIDPINAKWLDDITGVGASIDSFYEYAFKCAILFNNPDLEDVFRKSYKALLTHSSLSVPPYPGGANIFKTIDTKGGMLRSHWIDSLGAFFPGLQVLAGQVEDAKRTHLIYLRLWDYFGSIPERWNYQSYTKPTSIYDSVTLEWYPLRPEFIESTYYLYRATRDPMYLHIGEVILKQFQTKFKAACGFHGIQDIRTGRFQDRMETFVLSETLKYLYLLFDTDDEIFLHKEEMSRKNWVFSTEAHPLWLDNSMTHTFYEISKLTHFKRSKATSTNNDYVVTSIHTNNSIMPRSYSPDEIFDYYSQKLSSCEPGIPQNTHFISSSYYEWDSSTLVDYEYQDFLIQPNYLKDIPFSRSYIELMPSFFQKFALISPKKDALHLQCPRHATTESYDIILGELTDIKSTVISVFKDCTSLSSICHRYPQGGDLWVPYLDGLRLIIEKKEEGSIDSMNQDISKAYLDSIYNEMPDNSIYNRSASLRIVKLNGISISPNTRIWTLSLRDSNDKEKGSFAESSSTGRVSWDNMVFENLFVW